MKIIGLTGGIGSGKSTIANFFKELGVPVYTADDAAKEIMNTDLNLIAGIKNLLGEDAYVEGKLNRKWIGQKVFNDKSLLEGLNHIVHPAVAKDFERWVSQQKSTYVIKEAAILIENGNYKNCDYLILVKAPQSIRIERVMKRDSSSKDEVLSRIEMQWSDLRKEALADAVIENINLQIAKKQVQRLHFHILKRFKTVI